MRLQFSPLSSSSPAKATYSTAVQDRLAGVTYEGAKTSAREPSPDPISLLSPEPSSDIEGEIENRSECSLLD